MSNQLYVCASDLNLYSKNQGAKVLWSCYRYMVFTNFVVCSIVQLLTQYFTVTIIYSVSSYVNVICLARLKGGYVSTVLYFDYFKSFNS